MDRGLTAAVAGSDVEPVASIVILTYNGEERLRQLLDGVMAQSDAPPFEVVVIDSGSTDGTLSIVADFPAVRLHQIPNSEFGHGRTRNLALQLTRGEFLVYLTHDAVPASPYWLVEMLRPFELGEQVACVFGRQVPYADCCPTIKRDVAAVFDGFGPQHFLMVQAANSRITMQAALDQITFYSDVNSAVRRSVLERIPYRDVDYAEDQAFGRDVINAGLYKVYAPQGVVFHSNSFALRPYFGRMLDEFFGLKRATGRQLDMSWPELLRGTAKGTVHDWRFILNDASYPPREKAKWLAQAPLFNLARRVSIRLAHREDVPLWAKRLSGRRP